MCSSYEQIANLIARYAFATDDGDFAALGALFARGRLALNGGEPVSGAAGIAGLAEAVLQTYEGGSLRTRHVTTNLFIDVDEDAGTARSRSYFTVFQSLPELPLQPIAAGHYQDRFARVDGRWCFAERAVVTDFSGDVSHHVRAAAH
ncbi:MAG TPA: nuclear transport factor 2 family protein [Trebonia sp.]|jgi:3-phenylpropionate/cinnamic acid dioxygenase small subunit|nr:nuclear transport factor 2 family protein [Trebonia sp.]